jgi:two-component system CheB/CheR fusion protein
LQASNEELETLNEELHATVEELNTTNDDLEARTIELQEMAVASEGARARLEAILDNIGEAVVVVDRNGGIVIANPSFYRMFELDKLVVHIEEESGEALPPSASPIARASRGELFTMTFTTSMRGAGRRWFEAEGRPIPGGAQSRLGVVTFRDITDRSLRHLQEEWLALASHELRTPLTALQVYLQLAARPFQEKPDDPIGENLERAVEQAKRIGSIVRQIVDAARYQLGERKLEQDDVDLASLSERTSQLAAEVFGDARVHLELPTDRDRLIVSGSHERIQHLLYLVIEKAIGASPDDRAVQLHLQRNGDHAEFTIRAWGDGISQNDASKLFEPFYRGSKSDAPGLGMYIAREIAEQHGGAVDALDTNENGNIFRVRLPLKGPMQ